MTERLKILKLQSYTKFYRNVSRDSKIIYIFLTLCCLICVQSLDIDSAVCRCTTKSKFGKPFVVLWNSPTEGCHVNFSVNIELEKYGILTNSNQTWDGEVVTVFYNGQMGLYPFYRNDDKKRKYNVGLPQLVNLTEHLKKATQHIMEKIPEPQYSGLAVIDWEGWRPLWETNFGPKHLYQIESIALVKKEGKLKNKTKIKLEAKRRFETAGKRLMIETIELAKKLRPRALWGFYGYPDCHGTCTEQNKKWNNKLHWLYKSSTALFPSIYLMDDVSDNSKYVAERLKEAFRASRITDRPGYGHDLPVFPYLRPLYHFGAREFKMLNGDDLDNAIGQAVDFGSAGLILWGNHNDERTSREICLKYNDYVNNKLGPYITLLTEEVEICSKHKCFSNGRCVEEAVGGDGIDEKKTCKTAVKYGTVFKMDNTTSEIHQSPQQLPKSNTTTNDKSTASQNPKNTKMEKHDLLDTNKTDKHFIPKEDKNKSVVKAGHHEVSTSLQSTSQNEMNNILKEMFESSPNETRKKETEDPDWNKNSILGRNKKHKIDQIIQISLNNALGNISESKKQKILNGKRSNISQAIQKEIGGKRSKTEVNTTSPHKEQTSKRKTQKRGYSARVREETPVRVPGVYIILITVTLGGALLMTIIYVAIYYTVNVRGRSRDNSYDYEYGSGDENPFSVEPHSPWWHDDADPSEKLLKSKKDKK